MQVGRACGVEQVDWVARHIVSTFLWAGLHLDLRNVNLLDARGKPGAFWGVESHGRLPHNVGIVHDPRARTMVREAGKPSTTCKAGRTSP